MSLGNQWYTVRVSGRYTEFTWQCYNLGVTNSSRMDPDMDAKMEQLGRELTNFRFAEVSDSNSVSNCLVNQIWHLMLRHCRDQICTS